MRFRSLLLVAGAGVAVAVWTAASAPTVTAAPDGAGTPVVLELFTSQGCSSCPAADAVLHTLAGTAGDQGPIILLAYHVDYWNRLGWVDPFSDAQWTRRQGRYAEAFRTTRVYTPQVIVNGRTPLVGSDRPNILAAIARARRTPPAGRLDLHLTPPDAGGNQLHIDVSAQLREPVDAQELVVMVALFESGFRIPVQAGENAGRTLVNDYVVRRLERALAFAPTGTDARDGRITFTLAPDWDRAQLGVAAFLQDPATMVIHAGAVARLADPPRAAPQT